MPEWRFAALAAQVDGDFVRSGYRTTRRDQQRVCSRADPPPMFRNKVGELSNPPNPQLSQHVLKPILEPSSDRPPEIYRGFEAGLPS
jgi:hypothetical protein